MKKILFLLLLPATLWGIQTPDKTVRLECNLFDVPQNVDSVILYDLQGLASVPIQKAGLTEDKKYIFTLPKGPAKIYGVGVSELNVAKIILGEEDVVVLWANAKFMNKARTMGSDANTGLEKTLSRLQEFSDVDEAMLNEMKENSSGPIPDLYERAKQNQDAKMEFLDSLKKTNTMLYQIAGLFVHPSPFAMKKVPDSPVIYFGEHYFDNVKLNDPAFDNNPFVYDAFEELTTKLFERNCSDERAGIIVKSTWTDFRQAATATAWHWVEQLPDSNHTGPCTSNSPNNTLQRTATAIAEKSAGFLMKYPKQAFKPSE
ncbi:MAG: hypothetical protein R2792_06925 [Saprospiraceae bacterium]